MKAVYLEREINLYEKRLVQDATNLCKSDFVNHEIHKIISANIGIVFVKCKFLAN